MTFKELPSSSTIHTLPRSHWEKHLHNYENPGPKLTSSVLSFIDQWKGGAIPAPRLLITGKQGRGKTHLGVGIFRVGVYERGTGDCAFVSVPDLIKEVKKTYGNNTEAHDPIEDLQDKSLIILDDLFGVELRAHDINNIVPQIINMAYNKNQALVITANYSLDDMNAILHPHEMSRIMQNVIHINMVSGKDHRLKD